jgi:hypothetical protein
VFTLQKPPYLPIYGCLGACDAFSSFSIEVSRRLLCIHVHFKRNESVTAVSYWSKLAMLNNESKSPLCVQVFVNMWTLCRMWCASVWELLHLNKILIYNSVRTKMFIILRVRRKSNSSHTLNICRGLYIFNNNISVKCALIAQSVQRWAKGWKIRVWGFDSRRGLGIFLFTTASRTALGPTQPIQWTPGALSLEVKRPGCEADHSPPSSAEVKECVELYLHSHNTS